MEEKLQHNISSGTKSDIGINADELKEYDKWLSFEQAEFLSSNPDFLMDAIKIVLGKDCSLPVEKRAKYVLYGEMYF